VSRSEVASADSIERSGADQHDVDWENIYREHVSAIYRLIYAKVGNQADAEDLTSEVFVNALPHLHVAASGAQVHQYLVVTARSVLASHWRRWFGARITVLEEEIAPAPHLEVVDDGHKQLRVAQLMAQLPENYRRVLTLRFLESCTIKETAAAMGITENNAKVVQHRALRRAAELGLGSHE